MDHATALITARELFNRCEIPFQLMLSTLKGILVTGEPYPDDGEVDFICEARELTDERLNKLRQDKLFGWLIDNKSPYLGMIYLRLPKIGTLTPFYEKGNYMIGNATENSYQIMRKDWYKPFKKLTYRNLEWDIPNNVDKIFKSHYGRNWKTEDLIGWHWTQSKGMITQSLSEEQALESYKRAFG